jgi:hypothetical protein
VERIKDVSHRILSHSALPLDLRSNAGILYVASVSQADQSGLAGRQNRRKQFSDDVLIKPILGTTGNKLNYGFNKIFLRLKQCLGPGSGMASFFLLETGTSKVQ